MDPKGMQSVIESMIGGKTGSKLPGDVDAYGLQQMMEMMKQVDKDPEMKRQMEGYWKMLDNMQS
jgi:hypothetical protein